MFSYSFKSTDYVPKHIYEQLQQTTPSKAEEVVDVPAAPISKECAAKVREITDLKVIKPYGLDYYLKLLGF